MARMLVVLMLCTLGRVACADAQHTSKSIGALMGPDDTRDCTFFTLQGVSQADPNVASEWFAIPRIHQGFKEITALLLAAKVSGIPINVTTNGQTVCGHAGIRSVVMP